MFIIMAKRSKLKLIIKFDLSDKTNQTFLVIIALVLNNGLFD